MRRWNGWGDESASLAVDRDALTFLQTILGPGKKLTEATWDEVLLSVPPSRVTPHELLQTDPGVRVRHARGQSLPDWIAMKSGRFGVFPDAVAFPRTRDEVQRLLQLCVQNKYRVIPYGGGTSVAGHITPDSSKDPIVTISLRRMNLLLDIDETSQIATFGAGTYGPEIESQLRGLGFTLGHFPQSFELSTLGGWVATRSSGQQSLRYGRIEQLFAGGHLETLAGGWDIPVFPASAAGPDLRELVLGSEGRLGILTDIKVKVSRLPQKESFYGIFFPSWQHARNAVRTLVQERVPLSMLRLSNAKETMTNLTLAGHKSLIGLLEGYLKLRGAANDKCFLIMGLTGSSAQLAAARRHAYQILRHYQGVTTGTLLGNKWALGRFRAPYLRESLWQEGYMVDTVESATTWNGIDRLIAGIEGAVIRSFGEAGESSHVFTHLSHVYAQGSSVYTTFVFRAAPAYEETLSRWQKVKHNISMAIVDSGGTISHQHGVGKDHKDYLHFETSKIGIDLIRSVLTCADPESLLNPGTLVSPVLHTPAEGLS